MDDIDRKEKVRQFGIELWLSADASKRTRMANGYKRFKTGFYFSVKNNAEIFYRSRLEERAYITWDCDISISEYQSEPTILKYKRNGKWHLYFPDALLIMANGKKKLIEIKPSRFLKDEINLLKFAAARKYAKENDIDFEVLKF